MLSRSAEIMSFSFRILDNHVILSTDSGKEFEYFALGNASALAIDLMTRSHKEAKRVLQMTSMMHGKTLTHYKRLFEPVTTSLEFEPIDAHETMQNDTDDDSDLPLLDLDGF